MTKVKAAQRSTILLADGNAEGRRLLAKALSRGGYRVVLYGDGREALAYLQQEVPDLIVLDANLPHLGGTELCYRTKRVAHLRRVPVIIMAFASDTEALRRAATVRVERVLLKPVTGRAVTQAAKELLTRQDIP